MNSEDLAHIGMVICVALLGGALTWWFVSVAGWIFEILKLMRIIDHHLLEIRAQLILMGKKDK